MLVLAFGAMLPAVVAAAPGSNTLLGRVVDGTAGAPAGGATVTAFDTAGGVYQIRSAATGAYVLSGMPDGDYWLGVQVGGNAYVSTSRVALGGAERRLVSLRTQAGFVPSEAVDRFVTWAPAGGPVVGPLEVWNGLLPATGAGAAEGSVVVAGTGAAAGASPVLIGGGVVAAVAGTAVLAGAGDDEASPFTP